MRATLGLTGLNQVDAVFECSGAESCIQTGIFLLKKRGLFIQAGLNVDTC
jgi:threonine dehydrogenase-like Zn-dependent dehydrogenase